MAEVVVLHSGGLDSTVCLLLALENGHSVTSVGVNYDQTHQIELEFARQQCERFKVPRKLINVRWDKPQREIPRGRTIAEITKQKSPAFLPGRNLIFLALACAEAAGLGASEVWIGINQIDYSGYPDCTEAFKNKFDELIQIGIPTGPKIVAPLMNMTKPEIAREARRLGLTRDDTWSCYRPILKPDGTWISCNTCDACVLHAYAWDNV